ncbi:MAG TPA: cytochrome c3 family protein [Candidatus Acidoferrum sp.]|nr:cytochrome c3 family protein [Candidatus Acidoferrum sp.]
MRPSTILLALALLAIAASTAASRMMRIGVQQGYAPAQPIAFSHKLHAGDNQISCLYCHYGARTSRHAGIPAASVCMNCHALLEKQTVDIERIKETVQLQRPLIAWVKVHNLPDYVYFNHSRHVLGGVACQRCHGAVEAMERIEQAMPLTMGWCLDCHRENAGLPTSSLARAARRIARAPEPEPGRPGLDCANCHY